ncbi:MAG: TerB family tellurite resistance protein [Oligoflexia bacterium]|nr:TerB family tellurite resistance protein [Oligoflexia bacterium]
MRHKALVQTLQEDSIDQQPQSALSERADEVLIAVAILGLVATICDAEPDSREIQVFMSRYRRSFLLSRRRARQLVGVALRRINSAAQEAAIEGSIDCLNFHLNMEQKLSVFDGLTEIAIADNRIHEGEAIYLDYLAYRFDLLDRLSTEYQEWAKSDRAWTLQKSGHTKATAAERETGAVLEIETPCGRKVLSVNRRE